MGSLSRLKTNGRFYEKREETSTCGGHRPVPIVLRKKKRVLQRPWLRTKLRCRQEPVIRSHVNPLRYVASHVWLPLDNVEKDHSRRPCRPAEVSPPPRLAT